MKVLGSALIPTHDVHSRAQLRIATTLPFTAIPMQTIS
jgi:hypothetical protein